jgi:hypothetical protein
MVDDVGSALIREPEPHSLSSVPAPEFSEPMDLVLNLRAPLVQETVAPRFAADMDAVHVQKFDLGSVVRVHPDTTPGVRPVQALGISRASIMAFDAGTGEYSVMPIDGSFRRTRAVRAHQLEIVYREVLMRFTSLLARTHAAHLRGQLLLLWRRGMRLFRVSTTLRLNWHGCANFQRRQE